MPPRTQIRLGFTFALAGIVALSACAGGDDSAGAPDTAAAQAMADTPMVGMDHSNMPGMANRPPATDADHEFLRMMVDHHAGLIEMSTAAMTKASLPATQADAHELHTKQDQESKEMIAMVQRDYGETITPQVMPSNRAMNEALQTKSGADYDRTYYGNVIQHHREGIQMTDQLLPRLTKPAVREMAEKMKAEQQREITAFEQKVSRITAG